MKALELRAATAQAWSQTTVVVEVLVAGWTLHRNGEDLLILHAADLPPEVERRHRLEQAATVLGEIATERRNEVEPKVAGGRLEPIAEDGTEVAP